MPHEEKERIANYIELLSRWNEHIKLISPKALQNINNHIERALYLSETIKENTSKEEQLQHLDLGSGNGLPAIPLAISLNNKPTLIEADRRKAIFLSNVSRETLTPIKIITSRIEETEPIRANIITAQALAPLPALLTYCHSHQANHHTKLFLAKGTNITEELKQAKKEWTFHENYIKNEALRTSTLIITDLKTRDRPWQKLSAS